MNAPLARLYSSAQMQQQTTADERRREPRHATSFTAWLESPGEERLEVRLTDVSLHGCSVAGDTARMRLGAFLSIGIGSAAPLKAVTRWVRGQAAGMEFLHAVPSGAAEWHALMDLGY